MNIISFEFIAFVFVVIILYFLVPQKYQWMLLLAANILFYTFSSVKALVYVLATSLVTYFASVAIDRTVQKGKAILAEAETPEQKKHIKKLISRDKKCLCAFAITGSVGVWIVLKYGNFILHNFNIVLNALGTDKKFDALKIIIPLGISYYTFHSVGYLVDVYRGKYPAEHNFGKYFTFITFFPHVVQGPFSRYDQLGQSLFEGHHFSYDSFCEGCRRVLWGFFKKLIVADKLGIAVSLVFSDPTGYSGLYYVVGMVLYGLQIYADFSGYMDIMCGVCHAMGIKLAENFNQPYFAKSVDEFWRRWHITLGKWFKDYVFYPVSMGKTAQKMGKWARKKFGARTGKLFPGYFALIFVWTATGLWHGANWTYLVWGYLNLVIILFSMHMEENYNKMKEWLHINSEASWWKLFCIIRTFLIVCFLRYFSIAESVGTALRTFYHAATNIDIAVMLCPWRFFVGLSQKEIIVASLGCIMIFVVEILREKGIWEKTKRDCHFVVRNLVYTAMLFSIIFFAGGNNDLVGGFLYANF